MKRFIFFILTLGTLQIFGQTKPNIVLIIADDLNDYIQPLNSHPDVETPNLNNLAANGTTFYNAYCNAPLCAPSRTSFLTGKDVAYTQVYTNVHYKCSNFSDNFTEENGNSEYHTLPQYLKDSGGYYTYDINKIFHCHNNSLEYDSLTLNPCEKLLAWNKYLIYSDTTILYPLEDEANEGVPGYSFGRLNDTLENIMTDFVATDSAISFINEVAADPGYICDKPFFLALGLAKPHKSQFIPEKYFSDYYNTDYYGVPFNYSYNMPKNSYPQNGIILPPQPEILNADYYALPQDSMGQAMTKSVDDNFDNWANKFDPVPVIEPEFNDSIRFSILAWTERANAVMAYLAAVKFVDAQVGRFFEAISAHPEMLNNTIIIFIGDHGYGLGEKMHWGKYALWETDVRTSMIIADFRTPEPKITNRIVSLFDLYPTICDYAGLPHPLFADNSYYLDGYSLLPLIENPETEWERPALSSIEKLDDEEGHCFPQYSVRNEKFHYIRYQSNGGGDTVCDAANSYSEEELYELGVNRETDPYEWNNLIRNADYGPVKKYLSQWLPDSAMYLQKTFSAKIANQPVECIMSHDDTLVLHADIFDTTGIPVLVPPGFTCNWKNNLTDDVFTGTDLELPLSFLSDEIFNASSRILFYFEMTDSNSVIYGFDTKYFYINDNSEPTVSFTALQTGTQTCTITDFTIDGSYNEIWWDFGEGIIINAEKPGPYTYGKPGDYTVTCFVQYGNAEDCILEFSKDIVASDDSFLTTEPLFLYPNPASSQITAISSPGNLYGEFSIYNILGELAQTASNSEPGLSNFTIDISKLKSGMYVMRHGKQSAAFVVM